MKLIENWKLSWRFWSVRLGVLGTLVTGLFEAFPDWVLPMWTMMPDQVTALIPAHYLRWLGPIIYALAIGARFVKQPKLEEARGDRNEDDTKAA